MFVISMEKEPSKDEATPDDSNWSRDIENREYYYDDATGYEEYCPEEDEEDEEEEESSESRL